MDQQGENNSLPLFNPVDKVGANPTSSAKCNLMGLPWIESPRQVACCLITVCAPVWLPRSDIHQYSLATAAVVLPRLSLS